MKREPVMFVDNLTKEERKNFKKDHPGQRLVFYQRFPRFSLVLSIVALTTSVLVLLSKLL